jgi:hypothetical protein
MAGVVFLRKIVAGAASRSHGIHVAGLPRVGSKPVVAVEWKWNGSHPGEGSVEPVRPAHFVAPQWRSCGATWCLGIGRPEKALRRWHADCSQRLQSRRPLVKRNLRARRLLAAVLTIEGGCAGAKGVGPLPPPPPGQVQASDYVPDRPLAQVAPGLSARLTFAAVEGGYAVEVRDLLVAPGNASIPIVLPGAAVVEVRDGTGVLAIGETRREVAIGAAFAVSEDQKLAAEARGKPLLLRVHLFKAR